MEKLSDYDRFYKERQERLPRFPLVYGSLASFLLAKRLFSFFEKMPDKLNVLDCGSGSGQYPVWLINHFGREKFSAITGIEPSKWAVKYANQYVKKKGFSRIEYKCTELENFSSKKKFDALYAIEVFEHSKKPREFLKKAYKLLKPGGKIFLTTPNKKGYLKYLRFLKKLKRREKEFSGLSSDINIEEEHRNLFTVKKLRKLLREAGFEEIKFERNSLVYPGDWVDKKLPFILPLFFLEFIVLKRLSFFSWGIIALAKKPKPREFKEGIK